jgi:hypothetical protein
VLELSVVRGCNAVTVGSDLRADPSALVALNLRSRHKTVRLGLAQSVLFGSSHSYLSKRDDWNLRAVLDSWLLGDKNYLLCFTLPEASVYAAPLGSRSNS